MASWQDIRELEGKIYCVVEDYLKYREEVSKEFKENDKKDSGDHSKLNRLQGKCPVKPGIFVKHWT